MTARTFSRTILYVVLAIFGVIFLIPVYLLIITSLKSNSAVSLQQMWALPHPFGFSGIAQAWHQVAPDMMNSVYLATSATIVVTIIGSINGYALSKWKFRGANIIYFLILLGMFIPYQSTLIPLIRVLNTLNLFNTIPGLALVHIVYGIPMMTLIFRNFFADIPNELLESAQIDGNGYWGIFRNIMLPLSIPGFVVAAIWEFTQVWNDFLFGVTVTDPPLQPVTVAIVNIAGSQHIQWNVLMSSTLIASLPTLIVYLVLGRYFVRGLLAGSVKG
ncbi:carbohydrate ABC transporter permease [Alicyclobacillus mengziensis]|uniref:Carbohydrate ABC transporter permease n=1 Tax=Alicyclobacillus mengziensis TaxID=2931921 RepID=A0A9X7Z7C2_9BACL|nr:carbohydrate ABC transporter permease [Alicyclobacillus mengziensis]QSO47195.1 carbohydrate ABC transporter permease [Alicyclobacillus mengziensis]